jgi:hypothetical protein
MVVLVAKWFPRFGDIRGVSRGDADLLSLVAG